MRIQIITKDNGFGLSKDIQVLKEALPHCTVDVTDWQRPRTKGKWDWNIHLELVNPTHFRSATVNAYVPNPEWFDPKWKAHLPGFDIVLAKTLDCDRIFRALHNNVELVGWTSPDPGIRVDYERTDMVHCAGASVSKGTHELLQACAMVPEAKVTVIARTKPSKAPSKVTVKTGRLDDASFTEARRAPVHLCPSTYEGFGHYINEARAMGALIVTTDAPPMDEMVSVDYAILVPPCHTRTMREAREQVVCVDSLAEGMGHAQRLVRSHGKVLGDLAREAYERDRKLFHERIKELVK